MTVRRILPALLLVLTLAGCTPAEQTAVAPLLRGLAEWCNS